MQKGSTGGPHFLFAIVKFAMLFYEHQKKISTVPRFEMFHGRIRKSMTLTCGKLSINTHNMSCGCWYLCVNIIQIMKYIYLLATMIFSLMLPDVVNGQCNIILPVGATTISGISSATANGGDWYITGTGHLNITGGSGGHYYIDSGGYFQCYNTTGTNTIYVKKNGTVSLRGNSGANVIYYDTNTLVIDSNIVNLSKISCQPLNFYNLWSDSFSYNYQRSCNGFIFKIQAGTFSSTKKVITSYGDGITDTNNITNAYGGAYVAFAHTYAASNTYTVKIVLCNGAARTDSMSFVDVYKFCRSFSVQIYEEGNGNCIKDAGEPLTPFPSLFSVDSNGIRIDTISATSSFDYSAYAVPGDVYAFRPISLPAGVSVICPSPGFIGDTVRSSVAAYPDKYLGVTCSTGIAYDLRVSAVVPITGVHDEWGNIYVSNNSCLPVNATVTLHYSPKYNVDYGGGYLDVNPTPASHTSSSITWNVPNLASTPTNLYYAVWTNLAGGLLNPRDTVNSYITVTPTANDIDQSNNFIIRTDTVKAGCDPNEMFVSPSNCIALNTTAPLQYTINFTNTGNDTAHDIYVMDTLPANVNMRTLRLVMASATMKTSLIEDGAYKIARFDFPKINLLDSSHHGKCNGAVIFNINTMPDLPVGALIANHAGIFFDINPVVLTNTTVNRVGCPNAEVPVVNTGKAIIYPNPAIDDLTIKMALDSYSSYSVVNSVGQVLIKQPLNSTQTRVNVSRLSPGMYYIVLVGELGREVQKFVKIK